MTSAALAELHHLRRLGFRDEPILDERGAVEVISFTRTWRGWHEAVLVYSEHEARAYRVRPLAAASDPLHVDPATEAWLIPPGDVVTVVHALLSGLGQRVRVVGRRGRPKEKTEMTEMFELTYECANPNCAGRTIKLVRSRWTHLDTELTMCEPVNDPSRKATPKPTGNEPAERNTGF